MTTSTTSTTQGPTVARTGRDRVLNVVAAVAVALSFVVGALTDTPTLWGLLPIVAFAGLALAGMDMLVATVVAVACGIGVLLPSPTGAAEMFAGALADQVTAIGLIIVLGAGVGEVMRATGVAATIVHGVLRLVGRRTGTAFVLAVMIACLVLVACLGTLAGALAIAAPILLPAVSRLGYTRSATAAMMFIGGCAGLTLAPFAGSNVAIMQAAEVGYLQYLLYGAGPLAVLSLVVGLVVVGRVQRRTVGTGDDYAPEELEGVDLSATPHRVRATVVFAVVLVASVAYAILTSAGTALPLLALPLLGIVTGLAGGLSPLETSREFLAGAGKLVPILLMFWLLAVLFTLIDQIAPFEVVLEMFQGTLGGMAPLAFALVIAALGWVGVPGATAAQVVLLDEIFGPLAGTVGITPAAWVVVLLFASKADTYGPFPNANMVGAMGMARSANLRSILAVGWCVLVPACLMYVGILAWELL